MLLRKKTQPARPISLNRFSSVCRRSLDCGIAKLRCLAGKGAEEVSVEGAAPFDGFSPPYFLTKNNIPNTVAVGDPSGLP